MPYAPRCDAGPRHATDAPREGARIPRPGAVTVPSDHLLLQRWMAQYPLKARDVLIHDPEEGPGRLPGMERHFLGDLFWHYLNPERPEPIARETEDLLAFYAFAIAHRRKSHAQVLQDLWVLHQTSEKRGGYFVEFGACDGHKLSNTRLLEEDYAWTGLLAEPNPVWRDALRANRSAAISTKCVHRATGERIAFSCATVAELSRVAHLTPDDVHERNGTRREADRVEVETITLLDLLKEHSAPSHIDYLSIDTEGNEFEVLSDFDFAAYSFGLITIEHAGETEKRRAIHDLMVANGYARWHPEASRWDDWYVRRI